MLNGLSSPLRQFYYLAGLNLSSAPELGVKMQIDPADWKEIKKLLNEIEHGYTQFFLPNENDHVDELWVKQREIAMPSFMSYFNQGQLNYEEQVQERIERYFTPFTTEISQSFGLTVQELISIYNFLDELAYKKLNRPKFESDGKQTWEQFCDQMAEQMITPDKWIDFMPSHLKAPFELISDKGLIQRFSFNEISAFIGEDKAKCFINHFVCLRVESSFLYYTENNLLQYKPIFQVADETYQSFEIKQILHSIYNQLFEFCSQSIIEQKFYKRRGECLELKIIEIFKRFFGDKCFTYHGYFTQDGHEQDVLILYKNFAFIIEAKASNRTEPRRDPDKAYKHIESNFKETIQKGYDQAYRVKNKFLSNEVLEIFSDQKLQNKIIDIRTKNYHNAFSIIVTLERFGQIQNDLSLLLEISKDDTFPWSVCIDDLEVFFLMMEKYELELKEFIQYLEIREILHEKLICGDELELAGAFFEKKLNKKVVEEEEIIVTHPDMVSIIDHTYYKGLGFTNEKNLGRKSDGGHIYLNAH